MTAPTSPEGMARALRDIERECLRCAAAAERDEYEGSKGEARAWRAVAAMAKAGLQGSAPTDAGKERERIVAYLRERDRILLTEMAEAIERGDHLTPEADNG